MRSQITMDKEDKLSEKAYRNPNVTQLRVDIYKYLSHIIIESKYSDIPQTRIEMWTEDLLEMFLKEKDNG